MPHSVLLRTPQTILHLPLQLFWAQLGHSPDLVQVSSHQLGEGVGLVADRDPHALQQPTAMVALERARSPSSRIRMTSSSKAASSSRMWHRAGYRH